MRNVCRDWVWSFAGPVLVLSLRHMLELNGLFPDYNRLVVGEQPWKLISPLPYFSFHSLLDMLQVSLASN